MVTFIGNDTTTPPPSHLTFEASESAESLNSAIQRVVPQRLGVVEAVAKFIPTVLTQTVDTTSASIGLTEKGEINNAVLAGFPGLNNFSKQNQGALEVGSSVLDLIGSVFVAGRVFKTGSTINTALRGIKGGRAITLLEQNRKLALARVATLDRAIAAQTGQAGSKAFLADAVLFGVRTPSRKVVAGLARRASVKKNVVEGAIVEAQLGLLANENDFLFPGDLGTNLALASLGIAIPGIVGNLAANFEMRRFVNSDQINRLAFEAIDRGKFSATIENPLGYLDKGIGAELLKRGELESITTSGATTDLATAYFLARSAKQLEKAGKDGAGITFQLEETRTAFGNADEAIGFQLLERVFQSPIAGIATSSGKFAGDLNAAGVQHVMALTRVDDTAFLGVEQAMFLERNADPVRLVQANRDALNAAERKLVEDLADPTIGKEGITEIRAALKLVQFNKTLEPMVVRNMEMVPLEEAIAAGPGFTGKISSDTTQGLTIWEVSGTRQGKAIAIGSDGKMVLPKGFKDPSDMSLVETQGLFRAGDRALTSLTERISPPRITVSKKASWFELDFAEELMRRTGGKAIVIFQGGLTRESARVESLAQKSDIIRRKLATETPGQIGLSDNALILREQLNLPRLKSFERGQQGTDTTGVDRLILGAKNGDEIRNFTETQIKKTLNDFREATDLIKFSENEIDLLGNSFKLGVDRSREGREIADFLVWKRPIGNTYFTRDFLEARLATRQVDIFATLINDDAGAIVREISGALLTSADFRAAIRSRDLLDIQLLGSLPFRGNVSNQTSFQFGDFAFRDSPVLTSAQRVFDSAIRNAKAAFKKELDKPIRDLENRSASDIFAALRSPKNKASSQLFNQFISARRGWRLSGKTFTDSEGFITFQLENGSANREQWARLFDDAIMPKDAVIPFAKTSKGGAIQNVELNQLAFDGLQAYQEIARTIRKESNTVLRANGFGGLSEVPFYVPGRDFSNQFIKFIMDANGKVVQIVAENTEQQLAKSMRVLELDPKSILNRSPGFTTKSPDTIEQFQSIWNRAQNGLQDSNIPIIQLGSSNTGASLSPFIEFNAWESGIRQFQGQFNRLARDVIETAFKNQLRGAKSRASVFRVNKPNKFIKRDASVQNRNIHDIYSNVLLGRPPLNDVGSQVGRSFNLFESLIDDKLVKIDRAFQDINPFSGSAAATRQYNDLVKTIEDKMPFRDVTEFIEQRLGNKMPPSVRKATGSMNQVLAGLTLRWADFAHPMLNLTGMINTAPAVIRQFTQRVGESFDDYVRRVGPYAHVFQLKDGHAVGTVDMVKIIGRAVNRTFKGEAAYTKEAWREINGKGYLDQEVAEFHRQLETMTRSEGNFSKFWDQADRWVGMLSDKSEAFSRGFFHNAGVDVAKLLGMRGDVDIHAFAHDLANRGIANYNPLNRPEIFQGGIGAPIGLFQSYSWNFIQRNFRYLEVGDFRTMGIQMAMQGTMFGMVTIPGYQQYSDLINSVTDGETSPIDGVYKNFDRQTADLILMGLPSNLPRLFGASDGAALFTRGDTSPRIPIIQSAPPVAQMAKKLGSAISAGVDMFLEGGQGFSGDQLIEILGNATPSRPIASLADIYLGADIDVRGQVVSRQVQTTLGTVARLLGLKTLSEAKEAEAFHANKRQSEFQLIKRNRLNRATRTAIRAGRFNAIPQIAVDYLKTGGDPADLKGWLRDAMLAANLTRNERQLLRVLNDADKMNQVLRLLDAARPIE